MQPQRSSLKLAASALLMLFLFTGCLKDQCRNQYTIYRPVYKSLSTVRSEMKWEGAKDIENPGKIYLYGKYLLLNDVGKGIHVFDNSQPAAPKKLGFLRIWGNVDMAIRNNTLFADSYADLAVFPIDNWSAAKPAAFRNKVFADRNNYWGNTTSTDSVQVVVGYETKDTVVDCETARIWNECATCSFADRAGRPIMTNVNTAVAAAAAVNGTGGSMARFTLVDHYLYTVTTNTLAAFDVADPNNPQTLSSQQLGWTIETIYPFASKLFIGSNTGMLIFDITNPAAPAQQGTFSHARVCDPVIAEDQYAYVTLRSGGQPGTTCAGNLNELNVVDITNLSTPLLVKTYQLTNPHGLSKDGNRLFICDGRDGLKVFDASDINSLKLLQTFSNMGEAYDVIAHNNIALVVAKDGIYQFDYSDRDAVKLISKIPLSN